MTNKTLVDLMDEYIDSCDNEDKDESYGTERSEAEMHLWNFHAWLKKKGYRLPDLRDRP